MTKTTACIWLSTVLLGGCAGPPWPGRTADGAGVLRIAVMDPLALPLACECVAGYGQRQYDALGKFLQKRLDRPVEVSFVEALDGRADVTPGAWDLVIGKFSVACSDAERLHVKLRSMAMLTDQQGDITQHGLFIVRHADSARNIEDLRLRRLLLGPPDADEKHAAALTALEAFDVPVAAHPETIAGCNQAALSVIEKQADAAVVSSYAMPLLSGCGAIRKDELRIVGRTDPVPFIGVFAADRLSPAVATRILDALLQLRKSKRLLRALESREGFIALPELSPSGPWPDWRGPRRDGLTGDMPGGDKVTARLLWSRTLTGPGMAGLAVAAGYVVVADKDLRDRQDVFRCLDSDTGRQIWKLAYEADRAMDFTNTARANPVIHDGMVYLLNAFGQLHCLHLDSGKVVWKRDLLAEFGAALPQWGTCSTPLVVDGNLIVNPGAAEASLVALDRSNGTTVWSTPGREPGYASFIVAELGGVRQIVGYDAVSLGGWDPVTGRRLWELIPGEAGDYNVPTPIAVAGRLLVSTENNGTRLYSFDTSGQIKRDYDCVNMDLAPDTATPVVLDGLVFGLSGGLRCLDLDGNLEELWKQDDDDFQEYGCLIGGKGRVVVISQNGTLTFLNAERTGYAPVSRLTLFDAVAPMDRDVWSHPALVGNRLYIRNQAGVYCYLLD